MKKTINKYKPCPTCNGTGSIPIEEDKSKDKLWRLYKEFERLDAVRSQLLRPKQLSDGSALEIEDLSIAHLKVTDYIKCDGCSRSIDSTLVSSCVSAHMEDGEYDLTKEERNQLCMDNMFYCNNCLNDLGFCETCQKIFSRDMQKRINKDIWGEDG